MIPLDVTEGLASENVIEEQFTAVNNRLEAPGTLSEHVSITALMKTESTDNFKGYFITKQHSFHPKLSLSHLCSPHEAMPEEFQERALTDQ